MTELGRQNNDTRVCAIRENRELELLSQIARLESRHDLINQLSRLPGREVSSSKQEISQTLPAKRVA